MITAFRYLDKYEIDNDFLWRLLCRRDFEISQRPSITYSFVLQNVGPLLNLYDLIILT